MTREQAVGILLDRYEGDETAAMNALQCEHGLVSDNAVWLADCATVDLIKAVEVLDGRKEPA